MNNSLSLFYPTIFILIDLVGEGTAKALWMAEKLLWCAVVRTCQKLAPKGAEESCLQGGVSLGTSEQGD